MHGRLSSLAKDLRVFKRWIHRKWFYFFFCLSEDNFIDEGEWERKRKKRSALHRRNAHHKSPFFFVEIILHFFVIFFSLFSGRIFLHRTCVSFCSLNDSFISVNKDFTTNEHNEKEKEEKNESWASDKVPRSIKRNIVSVIALLHIKKNISIKKKKIEKAISKEKFLAS